MTSSARLTVLAASLLSAFVGTRATFEHDERASEPFAYVAPEGLDAQPPPAGALGKWIHTPLKGHGFPPNALWVRSPDRTPVAAADLDRMAKKMPQNFADVGVQWTHRRHETHTRPDGRRVGLIEGDCIKDTEVLGAKAKMSYRAMQLVFPENDGTSIVTVSFPPELADPWEARALASIDTARGVARRVSGPPAWAYVAFGLAGAALAWALVRLVGARAGARSPSAPRVP